MAETKNHLRCAMRSLARDRTDVQAASLLLSARLHGWPIWKSASSICAFCALRDEPDILTPWPDGKRVALPRVDGENLSMCWALDRMSLVTGRFGIQEPASESPSAGAAFDLILVPGLAFDCGGGRLGRGRGYYDRFLACASGFVVGVCFDDQVVGEVPREDHDALVNAIITPSSIVICR